MNKSNYNSQRIAKNTLFMYIRMIFTILIGFYTSRLILQNLGINDYGIYNVIGGTVTLFTFLNTAMGQATQRFLAFELGKNNPIRLKHMFSMCLNVHILIAIIIIILAEIISIWLLYNKLTIPIEKQNTAFWVLQASIIASVISITQVPYNAAIYAHEKLNIYAIITIIDATLKLFIAISLSWIDGNRLLYYGFGILGVIIITACLFRFYCTLNFKECKYHFYWNKEIFKTMTSYTSWSLIGNFAGMTADQGINILLNIFFGPGVNAARGIAVQIKTAIASFVYNFQGASIPQIIKLYANNEIEKMNNLVFKSSKLSFFLFFFIMCPVILELRQLLLLWLGQIPNFLIEFSTIILFTILIQSIGGTLQSIIQATGKIKKYQLTVGLLNLSIFPISYIILKNGGTPTHPFIITLAINAIVIIINLYNVWNLIKFPVKQYLKQVIKVDCLIFCIGFPIPYLFTLTMNENIIRCVFTFIISFIWNGIIILFIGLNKNERIWVINMISNRFKANPTK